MNYKIEKKDAFRFNVLEVIDKINIQAKENGFTSRDGKLNFPKIHFENLISCKYYPKNLEQIDTLVIEYTNIGMLNGLDCDITRQIEKDLDVKINTVHYTGEKVFRLYFVLDDSDRFPVSKRGRPNGDNNGN